MLILAVHIGDGVLPYWPLPALGFAGAALLLGAALRGVDDRQVGRLGLVSAALFVASQFHFRLPGAGSVHLLLNGVAGATLGRAAPAAVAVALALQALLLGHGGVTTLGLNVCIYALPAWLAGALWPFVPAGGRVRARLAGFALGSLAALLTVLLSAGAVWFGADDHLRRAAPLVVLANLPVVVIEGFAVAALVGPLSAVRPALRGRLPRTEPPTGPAPPAP